MKKVLIFLDYVIYWSIVLIPFSIGIATAPMNVFMGFLLAAFLAKKILKKESFFQKTAINTQLLLLFIITCLSVINSINYHDSFKGGIGRLLYHIFIFFIITQEIKDRRHIIKIIFSIVLGLILVSLDGLWQIKTGHSFIRRDFAPVVNLGLIRATSSFKDPNTLGIYLSGFSPIIFGLALYGYKNEKKNIFIFISLILLIGIILTFSRPTLLAVYIAIFFLALIRKNRLIIAILVILAIIFPFLLPRSIKNWAREVGHNPLRFMCNDDRIAAYRNSLNMIKEHPFIGLGANTYMKNYKKYKEFPEYRNAVTADYMYAHDIYLHMAAEIGLLGLGIFIWLLYKLFIELRSIYISLNEHYLKVLSLSLTACLVAFLVNGLTESSLYYSRVALIFWYIAGLSLSLKRFIKEDELVQKA